MQGLGGEHLADRQIELTLLNTTTAPNLHAQRYRMQELLARAEIMLPTVYYHGVQAPAGVDVQEVRVVARMTVQGVMYRGMACNACAGRIMTHECEACGATGYALTGPSSSLVYQIPCHVFLPAECC